MVEIVVTSPNSGSGRSQMGTNQNSPQIIVIPQSLLTQAAAVSSNKKPILKVAPSLKRPLPPSPPSPKEEEDDDSLNIQPVRKRANLDHLSPEEKLQRRKLKNRVAAQNARDKKRAKMEDMEDRLREMEEAMERVRRENEKLMELNERLTMENAQLRVVKHEQVSIIGPLSPPHTPEPHPKSISPSQTPVDPQGPPAVLPAPSGTAVSTPSALLPQAQGASGRAAKLERAWRAPQESTWMAQGMSLELEDSVEDEEADSLPIKKRKRWKS